MTLSFIAPSFFSKDTPLIFVLLVIPATMTLPNSSNRTRAGRFLTSKVSVNWTLARTTSPGLSTVPRLVFCVVPQLPHLCLLDLVQEFVILVAFFSGLEDFEHARDELIVCLQRVFLHPFEGFDQ